MISTAESNSALFAFEEIYLGWARNVIILIVAALAFLSFLGTHDIAYWTVMLSVFLLLIAQIDYFSQRQALVDQNVEIPIRIDLLWAGMTAFLLLLFWSLWKMDVASLNLNKT